MNPDQRQALQYSLAAEAFGLPTAGRQFDIFENLALIRAAARNSTQRPEGFSHVLDERLFAFRRSTSEQAACSPPLLESLDVGVGEQQRVAGDLRRDRLVEHKAEDVFHLGPAAPFDVA
jgi:hypothetical protein